MKKCIVEYKSVKSLIPFWTGPYILHKHKILHHMDYPQVMLFYYLILFILIFNGGEEAREK